MACAASSTLFGSSPAFAADEPLPTPQAAAFGADWVEGLRPEDLSPSRAAICIVDSGVAITPDTPADDPNGPIVLRLGIDGMPGTPPPGMSDAALHGTYMASAAIAPRNSWGTVGLHPLGRVISVRALRDGASTFDPDDIRQGMSRCRASSTSGYRLAAIVLSLGRSGLPTATEVAALEDQIASAHQDGISVVGAAGNDGGAHVDFPASVEGVLAVGAARRPGVLCPYATLTDEIDVYGPGCDVYETRDFADGTGSLSQTAGSSMAAVWTAETLALIRNLDPSLSRSQAENRLVTGVSRRYLDVRSAARWPETSTSAPATASIDTSQTEPLNRVPESAVSAPKSAAARPSRRTVARWRRPRLYLTLPRRTWKGDLRIKRRPLPTIRRSFVARNARYIVTLSRKPDAVFVRSTHARRWLRLRVQ